MSRDRFFLERREAVELHRTREGAVARSREDEHGLSRCRDEGAVVRHRWRALAPGEAPDDAPEELRRAAGPLASPALAPAAVDGLFEGLTALEREHPGARGEVRLREVCQRVLCADEGGVRADTRRYALVELRASVEREGRTASLQRERAFGGGEGLLAALPALLDDFRPLWELAERRLTAEPVPAGPVTVVLPPGADAGVFFHEVCGHPLEGDVVLRGASFLAARRGQRVAPEHVTVVDNPCRGEGALTYGIDDEGSPARKVPLLQGGVVAEPLLDREAAGGLGRAANGHGRRVSFRHPPLPRMGHTELEPHRGTLDELVAGVPRGLLVRYLTPRHVDLMSGDFSFYVVEAQEIAGGEVGGFIGPAILRGNGLTALAGIDAVGADWAPFFGLKGCGKLDHGPLPVSFGNPSVRIRGLTVSPWL